MSPSFKIKTTADSHPQKGKSVELFPVQMDRFWLIMSKQECTRWLECLWVPIPPR